MARSQPQRETLASDYFKRDPFDVRTYPPARRDRKGPPSAAGGAGGAPIPAGLPTPGESRVFPFVLRANLLTRSTTSSPQLKGPSLIRGLHVAKGGTPDGLQGIALGKALSSVTELNVAIATARPYTSLFTGLPAVGSTNGAPNDAASLLDMQTTILHDADSLGIIVLDRDWFLTITVACNNTGTPDEFHGYVTLLDAVPAEVLAFYAGG
jgi:hypothetical protein